VILTTKAVFRKLLVIFICHIDLGYYWYSLVASVGWKTSCNSQHHLTHEGLSCFKCQLSETHHKGTVDDSLGSLVVPNPNQVTQLERQ
jgi:hypothetical protein